MILANAPMKAGTHKLARILQERGLVWHSGILVGDRFKPHPHIRADKALPVAPEKYWELPDRAFIIGHVPYRELPFKTIVMLRDPRAMARSMARYRGVSTKSAVRRYYWERRGAKVNQQDFVTYCRAFNGWLGQAEILRFEDFGDYPETRTYRKTHSKPVLPDDCEDLFRDLGGHELMREWGYGTD